VHEELPADLLREVEDAEHVVAGFQCYLLFDLVLPGRETIVRRFLARQGAALAPGERAFLEAMARSRLSLYEVTAVTPDEGMSVKDLWRPGLPLRVRERLATRQIVTWDLLALRLAEMEPGVHEIHGGCYIYPRHHKDALLANLKRVAKALRKQQVAISDPAIDKNFGPLFHQAWLHAIKPVPMPKIVTPEADPMVFGKALYDVLDERVLRKALSDRADVTADEDGDSWDWHEPAELGRRTLAQMSLDGQRLRLEVHSCPRMERARAWLEELAGGAVRHASTRFESIEQAIRRLPKEKGEPEDEIPLEVQQQVLGDWKDQYYRKWLDEPIPALGGRTPRAAARLKTWRPRLTELVKDIEAMEARQAQRGRPAWDTGRLWEDLGLERS